MAGIKGRKGTAPAARPAAGAGKDAASVGGRDVQRGSGVEEAASRPEPRAKDWGVLQGCLSAIESPEAPVCYVTGPGLPETVWVGTYGGAIVRPGEVCEAITSDGKRHKL